MVDKRTGENLVTTLKVNDLPWLGEPIVLVTLTKCVFRRHLLQKATEKKKILNCELMRLDFKVQPRPG